MPKQFDRLRNDDGDSDEPENAVPKKKHSVRKEMKWRLGITGLWGLPKGQTEGTQDAENLDTDDGNLLEQKSERELRQRYRTAKNEIDLNWKSMLRTASLAKSYELAMNYNTLRDRKKEYLKRSRESYVKEFESFKDKMIESVGEEWRTFFRDRPKLERPGLTELIGYKVHHRPTVFDKLERLGPERLKDLGASEDKLKEMYNTAVDEMDKVAQKLVNNAAIEGFSFNLSKLVRGKQVENWERSVAFYYSWVRTFEMALGYDSTYSQNRPS